MMDYKMPKLPLPFDLENKAVLKQANLANRQLAELKGVVHTIPNESILINTLTLQEAKDSSEVENIVTTQDDLYRFDLKVENFEKSPVLSCETIMGQSYIVRLKTGMTSFHIWPIWRLL